MTQERDELSGKVQECEEELTMALKELQREQASLKIIKMQNNEVCSDSCISYDIIITSLRGVYFVY